MKLLYFLDVLLFFQNVKFCSRRIPVFLDVRLCHVPRDSGLLSTEKYEYKLFIDFASGEVLNFGLKVRSSLMLRIPTLPVPEIKALSLTKLHTSGGRRNM